MNRSPKVFCSHRSKDKPIVKEVAAKLAAAGIDPWVDEWEILPGADFVAAINHGLETCDAGLVFFSKEVEDGKWVQAEISALVHAITEGKPIIPILVDHDVRLPPLLRSLSSLGVHQIPELIEAIYQRTAKPPVAPPRGEVAQRRFVLKLRSVAADQIAVAAELDGAPVAAEQTSRLGPGFQFSYGDFLRARPLYSRHPSTVDAIADRDRDLRNLGRALGAVLFPAAVDAALTGLLDQAASAGEQVQLIVETAESKLLSIPFEAASLESGRVPCLEPAVNMFRHLDGCSARMPDPRAGPLKILVAVGAPDENKTPNSVLDIERELHTILNAIEQAQRHGNAAVHILEVGSVDEIRNALTQQTYHVLHLSGHGRAGQIELEDEDGAPVPAAAADLAAAVRESGRPAPLLFLASCHSGTGEGETASLAHGLLRQGIPAVVAMQSAVSDQYATSLAGFFYGNLCSESPVPSIALARARRSVESERRKSAGKGEQAAPAEYAAPALFVAADENPLLDRGLNQEPLRAPVRQPLTGLVPMLGMDDLIGRRRELRRLMGVLRDDPRTVGELGRKAGYQICGIGGVGKSALAGRAISRLAELNWIVATVGGKWNLGELASTVGLALGDHPDLARVARSLAAANEDQCKILLGNLLAQHPVLLVLDNFEDNLTIGGDEFLEPAMAALMEFLYRSAQRGKLLITSRYPLPRSEGWLATGNLGPLSPAETRKLFLRLAGIRQQKPESQSLVQRVIGGHPRALEYLNAILNRGHARMPEVERRLRARAGELGLNLNNPGVTLEQAVPQALKVAADDILLDELLDIFKADRDVLFQSSVFPMPVPAAAVESCLQVAEGSLRSSFDRLVQSSLLTQLADDEVWVHRWTAESLRTRMGEESFREHCRRGGEYLHARVAQTHSLSDATEAMRLFLSAGAYDRAVEMGEGVVSFLDRYGRSTDTAMLAREIVEGLPADHPERSRFVGSEADALLSLGFTGEAAARWRSIAAAREKLSLEHPDRADYLRDLSVSYERMGDLMGRLGDGEQARQFFRKALELRERLVRQEPDRADYLRDLSVSYERMGDLMGSLGDGEQARQFFRKALEIAERLVRQEPGRADYLRDLSFSYNKMGDLMGSLGDGDQARQFFQKALEIAERLVRQEPDRADYLRDLSFSYNKMGDLMGSLGDGDQARQFFQKALEIAERLVRQEPGRADYLRDLSVSYERMGDLMGGLGDGEQARQFFQKALEIAERLVRQEPDRADYLRDLSVSYNKMGDLMGSLGDGDQARQFFQKDLEIAERLVRQEPERADYLRDLPVSYNKMGDLMGSLGDGEQARQFFQKALEIRERLARQEPDRADYQTDLVVSLHRVGSREALNRALTILRTLEQQHRLTAQQAGWIATIEQSLK